MQRYYFLLYTLSSVVCAPIKHAAISATKNLNARGSANKSTASLRLAGVPDPATKDPAIAPVSGSTGQAVAESQTLQKTPFGVLFQPAKSRTSTDAFSNFAQHVYAVSATIMGLSTAKNPEQIQALANIGFTQEALEPIEAGVMVKNTPNNGGEPITFLKRYTPCILNGMQMAASNPTPEIAQLVASQMCIIRDAAILPNIFNLGQLSKAQNLIQFPSVGPLLENPIPVTPIDSKAFDDAMIALKCN